MSYQSWKCLAAALMLFGSTGASAATITFRETHYNEKTAGDLAGTYCTIVIEGELNDDDAGKFDAVVGATLQRGQRGYDPCIPTTLSINSPGGSVSAAIRIAEQVDRLALTVDAPDRLVPGRVCASACFFIWAAGKQRLGNAVAVHRPHVERQLYANLPVDQARRLYEDAEAISRAFLERHDIPISIINLMFSTDSRNSVFLSNDTLTMLRNKRYYEELLIARCGDSPREADARASSASDKGKTVREMVVSALSAKAAFMKCEFNTHLSVAREIAARAARP